ncbi:hypothetical protein EYC84_001014 [Monilinia fructicola]|uniref:V-SNARE coiled-coil homology domain-containing protein n=1 Tax=Monilinia fructicola TaxID=38448 RepID=A0A5M9JIT5_MONFR|nr:hypothetical protein EYC84_001014 [Monilinia fructicola]
MADHREPQYDPYIPSGGAAGAGSQQAGGNQRTAALQATIDDTVGVMRERTSTSLAVSAQGFRRGANRVRKQMWWKDMKMRMCLILGIIILLVIIISLLPSIKRVQTKNGKGHVNDGILGYRYYEKRDMNTCTEFHGTTRWTPKPLGLLHGETLQSWEGNERGSSDSGVEIFLRFFT